MSEHPLQDNVVELDTYRPPREGTEFENSGEEQQIDLRKYTVGSRYDSDAIRQTLASVTEKSHEPTIDVLRVRAIAANTSNVMAARIEGMHVSERPFLREVA